MAATLQILGWQRHAAFVYRVLPCIRLARGKFELTNQDSAGKKNSLSSLQGKLKGIEIKQLFSLEIALNIHLRVFTIPKTVSHCKKLKI